MGVSLSGDDDIISDINITPFVDIILVVLIIFMVTATQIVEESLLVNLPQAASGETPDNVSIGLTLLEGGELLMDGKPTSTEGVQRRLRAEKADGETVVVLIAADELVAHGRVVWLMDLVKTEDVAHFAINIDKATALPPDPAVVGKGLAPE